MYEMCSIQRKVDEMLCKVFHFRSLLSCLNTKKYCEVQCDKYGNIYKKGEGLSLTFIRRRWKLQRKQQGTVLSVLT